MKFDIIIKYDPDCMFFKWEWRVCWPPSERPMEDPWRSGRAWGNARSNKRALEKAQRWISEYKHNEETRGPATSMLTVEA